MTLREPSLNSLVHSTMRNLCVVMRFSPDGFGKRSCSSALGPWPVSGQFAGSLHASMGHACATPAGCCALSSIVIVVALFKGHIVKTNSPQGQQISAESVSSGPHVPSFSHRCADERACRMSGSVRQVVLCTADQTRRISSRRYSWATLPPATAPTDRGVCFET
jgi:hypothetical protein